MKKYGCETEFGDSTFLEKLLMKLIYYSDFKRTVIDEEPNYYFDELNEFIDLWVQETENRTVDSPDYMV